MNTQQFSETGLSYLPNSGSHVSIIIYKITNSKKVHQITTGAAESQIEPAFMKFLLVPIEVLPHRLSDEPLKAIPIKNIKSNKFQISYENK